MLDADLTIKEIKKEAHDVKTLKLDLAGRDVPFLPGQFLSVTVPTAEGPQFRSFSISSSPLTKDRLEITVKRYEDSSAAKALHEMKEGQTLHVKAPFGKFILDESDENIAMIAGGNGVTPLMSMLRYISGKNLPRRPTLLYSNRNPEDIIFRDELLDLEKHGFVNAQLTLTDKIPDGWTGLTGRADETMVRKVFGDLQKWHFYLCGPPPMVQAMVEILKNAGVGDERMRMEKFVRPKKPGQ